MTAIERTASALDRIAALDHRAGAFVHVDAEGARRSAAALAGLAAAGTDLGALAGTPVAIKDIIAVAGMPTRCGSHLDVSDIVGGEGSFVGRLRRAGAVILGKTRTTEFAIGSFNLDRPTPLNPWSGATPLMVGGSSNGSAVAVAMGMAELAVGTDTGGSVQLPAALCGVVGYKSSHGHWPLDGVFPLAPGLDSLGLFARSVAGIAAAVQAIDGMAAPGCAAGRLRLGVPTGLDAGLDLPVATAFAQALDRLRGAGIVLEPLDLPEVGEADRIFRAMSGLDLIVTLGEARIAAGWDRLDPVVRGRIDEVRGLPASEGVAVRRRLTDLARIARDRMAGFDGWIAPTTPVGPVPVADCRTLDAAMRWQGRSGRNTRVCNMLRLCGISLPVTSPSGGPPAGLMLMAPHGADAALLAMAAAIEAVLGPGPIAPSLG